MTGGELTFVIALGEFLAFFVAVMWVVGRK